MLLKRLAIIAAFAGSFGITGLLLYGEIRTMQVQGLPQQKLFLAGRIPSPALKGFLDYPAHSAQGDLVA